MAERRRSDYESGSAVVEFVLVTLIVVPLVLMIMQVALVLHVRNVTTAAASEGARAQAALGAPADAGRERTQAQIESGIADTFAQDISVSRTEVAGSAGVEVRVVSEVPALVGLLGPVFRVEVTGHAVSEVEP